MSVLSGEEEGFGVCGVVFLLGRDRGLHVKYTIIQ